MKGELSQNRSERKKSNSFPNVQTSTVILENDQLTQIFVSDFVLGRDNQHRDLSSLATQRKDEEHWKSDNVSKMRNLQIPSGA
jgi:hypothetical protein